MEIGHVPFVIKSYIYFLNSEITKFASCTALVCFQLSREAVTEHTASAATEAGKHRGCSQGCPRAAFLQPPHPGLARWRVLFAVLTAPFASVRLLLRGEQCHHAVL